MADSPLLEGNEATPQLPADVWFYMLRYICSAKELAIIAQTCRMLRELTQKASEHRVRRLLVDRQWLPVAVEHVLLNGHLVQSTDSEAPMSWCLHLWELIEQRRHTPSMAAGSYFSLIAADNEKANGRLQAVGAGSLGQLGNGVREDASDPQAVSLQHGVSVRHVSAGAAHNAIVAEDGRVFTFGDGRYHQLGHGNVRTLPVPARVQGLPECVETACGSRHTVYLTKTGLNTRAKTDLMLQQAKCMCQALAKGS